MKKPITATVEGVSLELCQSDFRKEGDPDLWMAECDWDGPNDPAPIGEWPQRIKTWRVAKQVEGGFEIWNLKDDRPKYWGKRQAVFRKGTPSTAPVREQQRIMTRNNASDPDSLYPIARHDCAPDTPKVADAIAKARALHVEAIEAGKRWRLAAKAIQRISEEEWIELPEMPGEE